MLKNQKHNTIYWDIVGYCNARCKYCYTGNKTHATGSYVDVAKFLKAMNVLIENELVGVDACFHLYTWGEPTLHPELGEIFKIITNFGYKYKISTNCGYTLMYEDNWFTNLDGIIISMSGYSQKSYDKIHKLDFETVKNNIIKLVKVADKVKYDKKKIIIAHHIYQFNIDEIPLLYEFSRQLGITYHPYYALLGNLEKTNRFLNGLLSQEEWIDISQNIIGFKIWERFNNHPQSGCKQFNRLVLDEECNVLTCCCLPKSHPSYKITNLFDPEFKQKIASWKPDANCNNCIAQKLSQYDEKGQGNFDINNWCRVNL